jgi:hypothetical protein
MSLATVNGKAWKNKYRAQAVVDPDHGRFDSKREHQRFHLLRMREKAGEIRNLKRQVPYAFVINGAQVGKIVMDFTYEEFTLEDLSPDYVAPKWAHIDEDCKGFQTPLSKLQHKLFAAIFGREIRIS